MKVVKILAAGLAGIVVLGLLGLGATLFIVDGQFVKTRLERAMKEKNRTLVIEGTPQLRLFPVAGLTLGKTTLSEAGDPKLFLGLESAEVGVRVMPLLSGEIAVEKLAVTGLKANVLKGKDGRMNFADLADAGEARKGEDREGHREPPKVKISEISIERAQLSYRDEAAGSEITVADLSLKTGRLDGAAPGAVSLAAHVTGKKPLLDLRAQASGALRVNLARQEVGFEGFSAGAKGRVDQDTLAVDFAAPKVEITPAKASGDEVKGTVQVKGPQRNVYLSFRITGIQGSADALSLGAMALDVDAETGGNSVKGKVSTPVKGNLKARTWDLPQIVANLTIAGPAIPQKTVTLPIQAAAKADLARQTASLEASTKFDESNIQAKLGATKFEPLAATFDLAIDRLNLDRYLPAESKEAAKDDRVDLSALKGKAVSGKIAIGALTAKHVKLEKLQAEVKLAGGRLEVAPHSMNLYGGSLTGAVSADANGNRIAVKENAQNIGIGALLKDAAQKDVLDGRGNLTVDVQTAGGTVTALKKALAGSARIEMKDGAIKGVNLADSARNIKGALGGKAAKPDPTQKTDFSELSASFKIANGVAHNDDLKAASPFLRLGGAGDIDIGNNSLNYLAKATLAATSKGQGGRDASQVAGITIPVKLSGPLDKPDWSIDYSGLLGGAGGSVTDTLKKGAGGVKDAAGGVTDKVRGLFRR